MIRKIAFAFAIAAMMFTTGCKNESASSKIDANAVDTPPARPEAVLDPEPNISSEPAPAPTTRQVPKDGKYPKMTFSKTEHDFGTISDEKAVTYSFNFENTGEADLIISSAKGSCGCTVPEYPKDPLKPGETGKIKISFNPSGKKGQQHKTVSIMTNTERGLEKLDIKATITPKAGSVAANQ